MSWGSRGADDLSLQLMQPDSRADHPLAEAELHPAKKLPGEGVKEAAAQLRAGCDALGKLGAAAQF